MSEETGVTEDGQEPSMEEILASIRRILSENDEEKIAAVEAELHPDAGGVVSSENQPDVGIESLTDAAEGPVPEVPLNIDQDQGLDPDLELSSGTDPSLDSEAIQGTADVPPVMEAILDLTPEMIATEIMSEPTAQTSTDVLSELAAAILDRRDMAVDASSRDMTLEGIVREMLKPILREWLDRNLPYLIERLVKREIDLMVNRAERLED